MNKKIAAVLLLLGLFAIGGCDKKENQENQDENSGTKENQSELKDTQSKTEDEIDKGETDIRRKADEGEIIKLGEEGELLLKLKDDWRIQTETAAQGELMTFSISKTEDSSFDILLSVLKKTEESGEVDAGEILTEEWESLKESAVEKEISIKDISNGEFKGSYFMPITDKNSQNVGDDYKYLSKAIVHNDKIMLFFSYLSRKKNDEVFNEWLNLINNLEFSEEMTAEREMYLNYF